MKGYNNILKTIFCILTAIFLGIFSSYFLIKSYEPLYNNIYNKSQKFLIEKNIFKNNTSTALIGFENKTEKNLPILTPEKDTSINLGFVGDIIPGQKTNDEIFSDISYYTEQPDLMIGNLEGVITDKENKKCKNDSANCFAFSGDKNFVNLLKNAYFKVLMLSNNHFNDYGNQGQKETKEEILNAKMIPSGLKNEITYIKRNNINISIIGFSSYEWTTNMNNKLKMKELIREAKLNSDILIVMFHGGGEGEKYDHTQNIEESYMGEPRGNLIEFSHNAIDFGADIVVGSGPHILRGIELYNGKIIAYSLGNFASSNRVSLSGSLKITGILNVKLEKMGNIISGNFLPFIIDDYGIPHPDNKGRAISMINTLSKEDFGSNAIKLSSSGLMILQ